MSLPYVLLSNVSSIRPVVKCLFHMSCCQMSLLYVLLLNVSHICPVVKCLFQMSWHQITFSNRSYQISLTNVHISNYFFRMFRYQMSFYKSLFPTVLTLPKYIFPNVLILNVFSKCPVVKCVFKCVVSKSFSNCIDIQYPFPNVFFQMSCFYPSFVKCLSVYNFTFFKSPFCKCLLKLPFWHNHFVFLKFYLRQTSFCVMSFKQEAFTFWNAIIMPI